MYADGVFSGLLIANMKNEKKKYKSAFMSAYVRIFEFLQHLFFSGADAYDRANKKMFRKYIKNNSPDGEIIFLACNPDIKGKGLGSMLPSEFERREKNKQIYLYTDNACTYQFYEHRGFTRSGEKHIVIDLNGKKVPLKCFLYSKKTDG